MSPIDAVFGDPPASLPGGWRGSDTITSSDSGVATVAGNNVVFHAVGTCTLTNTSRHGRRVNVTVGPADQTISLEPTQTVTFASGASVALTATSSAGLPVHYQSSDAAVAEAISGGASVVIRGHGLATLTANADGDENHNDAAPAQQVLTVEPIDQTISLAAQQPMAVGSTRHLPATSSEGLTVSYQSDASGIASVTGNILSAVAPGTAVITASQDGAPGVNAAAPASQQVVVFTFDGPTDGATGLTDVEVSLQGASVSGSGGLSAVDAIADNDNSPKHFRLDVPDYLATGPAGRVQPHTYLHLGAYPTEGSLLDRGDDILKAVGLEADVDGLVADRWFFDDDRKNAGNQKSDTVYNRDDFQTQTTQTAPTLTAQLLKRGGWREHTDGNRISTTRGDRVDIIGGNYRLLVLGRMWDLESLHAGTASPDPKHEWGFSYWESSGGHNRDSTNTPGEVARIAWKDDSWQVIHETIKGDVESVHYGVSEEYFIGPSIKSRVGSSASSSSGIPDAAVERAEQQVGGLPDWNNAAGRLRERPTVTETTEASTITSHTIVKTTVTETTDVDGTIKSDTLAGGSGVTINSYTPNSSGSSGSIPKFKERTHACAMLGYEEFDTKDEKEEGDWSLEVDLPAILAADFRLGAAATLLLGDFSVNVNLNLFQLEAFVGVSSTTKVGVFFDLNAVSSTDHTVGKKYHLTVPLRAKLESLSSSTDAAEVTVAPADTSVTGTDTQT